MRDIVIVGCGGFGREVHDVIDAINAVEATWNVIGYVDDAPSPENTQLIEARGQRVLGGIDDLLQRDPVAYTIGIGRTRTRRGIDEKFLARGWQAATLIHPSVTMGHDVRIGEGSVICAGARLTTNIALGRQTHLNLNVTVGHDCTLGDYLSVNPLVAISGWVTTGECVMFGTHSAILQNLSVGADAVIGAGSCVVKNVPSDVTVKGVPAK